jgi:segregation and condensation protein A
MRADRRNRVESVEPTEPVPTAEPESAAEPARPHDAAPSDLAFPEGVHPDGVHPEAASAEATAPAEEQVPEPGEVRTGRGRANAFQVHLEEFEGPFDLLLSLIAKHKLDVTTLALSKVTDEFIAFINSKGSDWDLDQASEFLLVAATLLDLKAARLLPAAEVEDEEDLALLEARDLLFARLLQYRAYKQVASELAQRFAFGSLRHPRSVPLEPAFKELLPEVLISLSPEQFAALAVRAMTPRQAPTVSIEHIHQISVSIREQANVIAEKLRRLRTATFRTLIADAPDTIHIVARFLALLELFREKAVGFDQLAPFGELTVRWTGTDEGEIEVEEEFEGSPDQQTEPESDDERPVTLAVVPAQRTQEASE